MEQLERDMKTFVEEVNTSLEESRPDKIFDEMDRQMKSYVDESTRSSRAFISSLKSGEPIKKYLPPPPPPADEILPKPEEIIGRPPRSVEDVESKIDRIMYSSQPDDYLEAVMMDVIDVIPFVGDGTGLSRLSDATKRGDTTRKKLQALSAVSASLPFPFSVIWNAINPSNQIAYIIDKLKEKTGYEIPFLKGGE